MNLNRGIYAIYVYSDVIHTKLVGDSSVDPLCGVFGEMVFKEYYYPVYTPLAKHVFSTIEMYRITVREDMYQCLLIR